MLTTKAVMWQRIDSVSLEPLTLTEYDEGVHLDSVVIGMENNTPFRLHYYIGCDANYRVKRVYIQLDSDRQKPLQLFSDGEGHWFDGQNTPLPQLDGCIDIDITATPFTNTLPVRRLDWQKGQKRTLNMVYFYIPEMKFERDEQEYTCLEQTSKGSVFQFAQPDFTARITFDSNGLVTDYPELFRRLT